MIALLVRLLLYAWYVGNEWGELRNRQSLWRLLLVSPRALTKYRRLIETPVGGRGARQAARGQTTELSSRRIGVLWAVSTRKARAF
jgi:hypothetical protein